MCNISGNSVNDFTSRYTNLPTEDLEILQKSIPDNIGIYRVTGITGYSEDDTIRELAEKYTYFYDLSKIDTIDTLIFIVPQFSVGNYNTVESYHCNGYRDLEKDIIMIPRNPIGLNSLSLVCEFKSGRNFKIGRGGVEEEMFYTLGHVFELGSKFRDRIVKYLGEDYRNVPEKVFLVTSTYLETGDTLSTLKSLHIIMKGIYKVAGLHNSVPLKKWVESVRRLGAKGYISSLVHEQKNQRARLVNEVENLKAQMNDFFRKINPIDFFLNDTEGVLLKINEELVNCEKIKGVKSAYLDRYGSFHIFTEHIYIKQPTTQVSIPGLSAGESEKVFGELQNMYWDIGKLHITAKKDGTVYIVSNTRQVKGYNGNYVGHPHVIRTDNSVCLGEIETVVFELLNLHEYSTLAGLLVNFAKSVNLGDTAGKYIRRWPTIQLKPSSETANH